MIELHQGDKVTNLDAVPGDYAAFYRKMAEFLNGAGELPVSKSLALQVAEIIDQARNF